MRYILIGSLAALAACGDAEEAPPEPTADEEIAEVVEAEEEREEVVAASETLSSAQEFIDSVAQAGAIHVGMAKIAMDEAEREDVQVFAENAIDVNQQLLTGLRDVAEGATESLQVETVLSDEQERNFAQLRGARSISDMYLERTRSSYDEVAGQLANYAAEGEIAALREWAAEASTMFDAHLDDLRAL